MVVERHKGSLGGLETAPVPPLAVGEVLPAPLPLGARLLRLLQGLGKLLADLLAFARAMANAFAPGLARTRKLRPWMLVRRARARSAGLTLQASDEDMRRLLERIKQLNDTDALAQHAVGFAGESADFLANPREVEEIILALIRENPPFLHVAREMPDEAEGLSHTRETEYILREQDVTITEPMTLFIPQVGTEYLESRRPPGYPLLRTARTLSDLRQASMLYQNLPEDLLIARLVEGSIPLLAYEEERHYLLFEPQERLLTHTEHRRTQVPVEIETGGEADGARLMYMLFDRSTSLVRNCAQRGTNAVMELAIALAMLRADLGRPRARYYFRAFAERLDPIAVDPPVVATTVQEKDALVRRLFSTNFSGEATNVVEALQTAADDIERIVASGELGEGVKPRIVLLTDGRASIYSAVGARLKSLGIELDTILIGKEASRNPELERISSTVSIVDPAIYRAAREAGERGTGRAA